MDHVDVTVAGKRPEAATLLPVIFDDRGRLRPEAKRRLVAELRCPRRRHLVAVVVRTAHGPWAAWHLPTSGAPGPWIRTSGLGPWARWECAWVDPSSIRSAACSCRSRNQDGENVHKGWIVPLYWLAEQHGTVLARMR